MIAPTGSLTEIDNLLSEFEARHQPRERRDYLLEFPGFSRVFGLRVVGTPYRAELPADLDAKIVASDVPHVILADAVVRALGVLETNRSEFDLVMLYLPVRWERGFEGAEGEDFDLHDYLKAVTASRGVPLQIVREDKALAYPCRCSVMWRLGIATYCKAGGIPWKLAHADPEMAFIGLSYAFRTVGGQQQRFVTCCSQVFDADGAGLEFLAYETDDVHFERENPFLSRSEMRRVMARSLVLYQRRHNGRVPKYVAVHKSTEFKPDEVEGCFDAWPSPEGLDLVQVQQRISWRGVHIEAPRDRSSTKGAPGSYPVQRGSYLHLGGREVLLWTQGNMPDVARGRNFYKEGKGIPRPLLLVRFAGHGPWHNGCLHVLGLTKMDWNNDGPYDQLPVTMGYAQVLARTVKRMPSLAPRPYQFRFFM